MIDIGKRIIHPDTTYPQAREAPGCTNMYHTPLGNTPKPSRPIAARAPRFKTALATIFADESVEDIDPRALAEIAALASSYQPTRESAISADPTSSPHLDLMGQSSTATPSPDILVPQTQSTSEKNS